MSLLLPTHKRALVKAVAGVSIHGQEFVDLAFSLEEEPGVERRARVGRSDVTGTLAPGQTVMIYFVMGVATSVKVLPE